MKTNSILLSIFVTLSASGVAISQQPKPEIHIAPNAPKDKPVNAEEGNFVGNFLDSYQVTTVEEAPVWRKEAATPARMNQRIEEAAIKLAAQAPIPRLVLYNIGYPNGGQEYTALNGNAVVLFTALSQVREELPLQRVYVSSEGKEIELKLLKVVLAELPATDTTSAKTFGRFRADALYLLPMSLRVKNCDLLVDFQKTGWRSK